MSMARASYVRCDRCGNPAPVSTDGGCTARLIAKNEGWERIDGQDVCPWCLEGDTNSVDASTVPSSEPTTPHQSNNKEPKP